MEEQLFIASPQDILEALVTANINVLRGATKVRIEPLFVEREEAGRHWWETPTMDIHYRVYVER